VTNRPSKAPPKPARPRKKRMGYLSDAPKIALREIIHRSVMGKSKLWPIDPKFPPNGTLEDRFNHGTGDKQILLWAINESAQSRLLVLSGLLRR
jgi:hypothetical protein